MRTLAHIRVCFGLNMGFRKSRIWERKARMSGGKERRSVRLGRELIQRNRPSSPDSSQRCSTTLPLNPLRNLQTLLNGVQSA